MSTSSERPVSSARSHLPGERWGVQSERNERKEAARQNRNETETREAAAVREER
jgi:hypothetical protein